MLTRWRRWYFAPAPPARLALFRAAVGLYAAGWSAVRLPAHLDLADRPPHRWDLVGPWSLLDGPPADAVVVVVAVVAPLLGLAVASGRGHRVVGPLGAVWFLALASLASSWGQVFHTENLMVLHLAVLAVAPGCRLPRRAGTDAGAGPGAAEGGFGWPLQLAALLVVCTYVLAGVAKLRIGGATWLDGDVLRNLVAHDNLRKAVLGDVHSPLGTALVGHAWVFGPLAWATLAVELGAPVALLGGRWRNAWIAAAWTFHLGVLALMAVLFPYPLLGVAFLPFLPLERVLERTRGRRQRPTTPPDGRARSDVGRAQPPSR